MSSCFICKAEFIDIDKKVKCIMCSNYFHANYTQKGKAKDNCANINASEDKLVNMKQPYLYVYRCEECTRNNVITNKLEEHIKELNINLKNLEQLKTSLNSLPQLVDELKNINTIVLPKIKGDIQRIESKVDNLEEKVDAHLLLLNPNDIDQQKVQDVVCCD